MKKTLSLVVGLMVVALVAAPAAQAATNPLQQFGESVRRQFNRLYLMVPGNKPGTAVLDQTTEAMKKVKSVSTTMTVGATATDLADQELFEASLAFSGPMEVKDVYDPETVKQDLNMRGELSVQGTTLRANADLKIDGDVVYFNIRELPALPNMNLTAIQNQWLKVESKSEAEVADETEKNVRTPEQTAELEAAFKDLVKASQIGEARREDLDGTGVFVIDIEVPDEALLAYTQKVEAINDTDADGMTEEKVEQMRKVLAAIDPITATVWVDRSTYFVRRAEMPLVIDAQKLMPSTDDEVEVASLPTSLNSTENIKAVTVNFRVDMDNFNEPVTFTVPTEARDAQEVFGEVFGLGAMGGSGLPTDAASGVGAGYPTMMPGVNSKLPAGTRPTELPELTPEEREILKQYGVEVEDL